MIKDFQHQKANTIMDFLTQEGNRPRIFSTCLDGYHPLLRDNKTYIYSYSNEMVVVVFDNSTAKHELAEDKPFSGEKYPFFYSESAHRQSPVAALSELLQDISKTLNEYGLEPPRIWGVLVMHPSILNKDDVMEKWQQNNITVIDEVTFDEEPELPLNDNWNMSAAKWTRALIDKKSDSLISDLFKFQKLRDDVLKSKTDEHNDDDEDDDDDDDDFDLNLDDDDDDLNLDDDDDEFLWPDGELRLHPNNTVRVEILHPIKNPREELDKLVGCKDIKNRIDEMVELTSYNKMIQNLNPEGKLHVVSLHGIFTGRPGTGKTTLCKIYGSLLREAGVLSKGHVVVTSRNTFIGSNWGDEERVIREVVEMAQGGVLMIDEASLLNGDNKNDPGKMVIPLLMDILANEKERDIAIILCGYKNEMGKLIDLNPGLQSRFPNKFDFPDFTIDELLEITRRRIKEYNYHFTRSAWAKYKSLLELAFTNRDPLTWGNARFVANQLERIYVNHAHRCVRARKMDKKHILTITSADIEAIEVPTPKPRIGF